MKIHLKFAALALLLTLPPQSETVFAQGSLTPPGAPAPMMKTLSQIEPRIAITNAGAVTISTPGSYYLTTNITVSSGNAITIATNGVTLDLNGFTVASTVASASGIAIQINSGLRNLAIMNGFIQGGATNNGSGVFSGSGVAYGIHYSGVAPFSVRVSHISVAGCRWDGIDLGTGDATIVESCTARTIGGVGISASVVSDCAASDCGGNAIQAQTATRCHGRSVANDGVHAVTAESCTGYSVSGQGVRASSAMNCFGFSNSGSGIMAEVASHCYATNNGSTLSVALSATVVDGCVGYNSGSGTGISAERVVTSSFGSGYHGLATSGQASSCKGIGTGNGNGVLADVAADCIGSTTGSGNGVHAMWMANNCKGNSATGVGLYAYIIAMDCYGGSSSNVIGLQTFIANTCRGDGTSGTGVSATYKYNMP